MEPTINWKPLTPETWDDFESLFGSKGACAGCWCMLWRSKPAVYEAERGEGNRKAMRQLVFGGELTGILGYIDEIPAAWCSVAPRSTFPSLKRSRLFKAHDNAPNWSVSCLFIAKAFRRKGLSVQMLKAAVLWAEQNGAPALEGYPVIPKDEAMPDVFAWHGLQQAYVAAGFEEIDRPSPTRARMHCKINTSVHADG